MQIGLNNIKPVKEKKLKHLCTIYYTNLNESTILILEVPDSMARAQHSCFETHYKQSTGLFLPLRGRSLSPELNQFMLEFDLGRLCGMTLYEILSLAIDLAILILTALSYLKNRKS